MKLRINVVPFIAGIVITCLLFYACEFKQSKNSVNYSEITIGIVTDVHADMMPDGKKRMDKFILEATELNADMIIQLGDFCRPKENEKYMMDSWNNFEGEKYHVLGNHDMDFNTKEEVINFWMMPSKYYSFDKGGYHFIILDANYLYKEGEYIDYEHANFYVENEQRAYINPDQIKWLKIDLESTNKPTLVFSHQSLINVLWGIKNRIEVQEIFEEENNKAGFKKVIACFNGHDHIDFYRKINGIHYFEINSLGYQWMGDGYTESNCYDSLTTSKYSHLNKIAIYQDPLYAFLTIKNNELIIKGVQSKWYCFSPYDKGVYEKAYGCKYTPEISNHKIGIQ